MKRLIITMAMAVFLLTTTGLQPQPQGARPVGSG